VDAIIRAFEDGGSGGMADIIAKENETGKIYCRGFDAQGRCLLLMRPGRENTMREDDNMRHLVFQLEKAIACSAKNGQGKLCLVIDYDGFTLAKSPPLATSKRTLDILQRHYCERMHRAYVCNPPFVFRSFWAIIKPFVDPVTKEKVCFCVGKKGFAKIADDLGGTDPAHRQLEKCASGVETVRDFDSKEYLGLPFHVAFDEEARLE
jgi:CRAL/TRIO domain